MKNHVIHSGYFLFSYSLIWDVLVLGRFFDDVKSVADGMNKYYEHVQKTKQDEKKIHQMLHPVRYV